MLIILKGAKTVGGTEVFAKKPWERYSKMGMMGGEYQEGRREGSGSSHRCFLSSRHRVKRPGIRKHHSCCQQGAHRQIREKHESQTLVQSVSASTVVVESPVLGLAGRKPQDDSASQTGKF